MDKQGSKRKRQSNGVDVPSKKVAVEAKGTKINVIYRNEEGLHPSLVASPGLTAPTIPFTAYAKPLSTRHTATTAPNPTSHNILLHSAQHPRLDYTATPSALDQHQSHYIAVFDPTTSTLQLSPAHHLSLRSIPRKISEDVLAQKQKQQRNIYQQREQLGQEFGTKKAKKAIASKTENAISKGPNNPKGSQSDAAAAVLESVADVAEATPNKVDAEQDLLASKPIPTPNLSAETVEEVYPLNVLLPPSDARLVPVKGWQDKARAKEEFGLMHRYPANRVEAVGQSEDVQKLKALGYLALLLEFHDALQGAGKTGKKVPKKEVFAKKLSPFWPEPLVDSVRRRFADPSNALPKWHLENLYTHICALTLYIDGWTTNSMDLRDDLKMENRQITQYFSELGCRVGPPTEKEREKMAVGKAQGAAMRVARLRLPLEFPKARIARRR